MPNFSHGHQKKPDALECAKDGAQISLSPREFPSCRQDAGGTKLNPREFSQKTLIPEVFQGRKTSG
ncbi:MAG TPA: hypothetical protein PLV89_04815 [Treponemataceae bacterium]|nr:hypothetical protein [Treponemataceae bacterium]